MMARLITHTQNYNSVVGETIKLSFSNKPSVPSPPTRSFSNSTPKGCLTTFRTPTIGSGIVPRRSPSPVSPIPVANSFYFNTTVQAISQVMMPLVARPLTKSRRPVNTSSFASLPPGNCNHLRLSNHRYSSGLPCASESLIPISLQDLLRLRSLRSLHSDLRRTAAVARNKSPSYDTPTHGSPIPDEPNYSMRRDGQRRRARARARAGRPHGAILTTRRDQPGFGAQRRTLPLILRRQRKSLATIEDAALIDRLHGGMDFNCFCPRDERAWQQDWTSTRLRQPWQPDRHPLRRQYSMELAYNCGG